MGALTDNRKRCLVDLYFPPLPNSSPPSFPSKKLKPSAPPPKDPPLPSHPPRFPPAAPLRRPVQGPQRILNAFGLGNRPAPLPSRELEAGPSNGPRRSVGVGRKMGNLMARLCDQEQRDAGSAGLTGLKFDEYRRLVEEVEEEGAAVRKRGEEGVGDGDVCGTPSPVQGAGVGEDERRVVENAGESGGKDDELKQTVNLELTPVREDGEWSRRTTPVYTTPVYKSLMEDSARRYDGKLKLLDVEVKLAEKKMSAFRIASKEEEVEEDKDGPFAPLSEEDENDVSFALQDPARSSQLHDVLVTHESSNIEITRQMIQCLRHGAWLNDEVINLYFELLKEREKRNPKQFLKCHFFNTFFYKKLTSGREGYDYKAVRRWTTQRKIGYALNECDKIFVPIHKEIHWCLAVINRKDKKFQYLDSLGKMDRGVLHVLAKYLVDEVKDKSDEIIDVKSWKQEFVDNLPLQKNGWDCGVFMIKYADFFSRGLALTFGQEHMGYFRRRTAKEILRLKAD